MTFRIEQMNRSSIPFWVNSRDCNVKDNHNRITPGRHACCPPHGHLPYWDEVEIAWDTIDETLSMLLISLAEIYKAVADLYADGHEHLQDVLADISNCGTQAERSRSQYFMA